jgi:hypothetical protein
VRLHFRIPALDGSQEKPRCAREKAKESQGGRAEKANQSQASGPAKAKESQSKPTKAKVFAALTARPAQS